MDAELFFNQGVEKSRNRDLKGAIEDYTVPAPYQLDSLVEIV